MKLIKLTDDHYVVVDDSEIKEGDWCLDFDNKRIYQSKTDEHKGIFKKITHSTQPLESIVTENSFKSYEFISLQEVKELIGEVDVEKKAREEVERYMISTSSIDLKAKIQRFQGYMKGYNQALEDNKEKKYTEEDLHYLLNLLTYDDLTEDEKIQSCIEYIKNLLQPKTSWEVKWEICETYKLDECNSRFACCNKPKKLKLK